MLSNLFLGANSAIAACYFAIAFLIFRGLMRGQQHLLKNPLVVATAAIFLTCALGHSAHILVMAAGEQRRLLPLMSVQVGVDWITAMVAVTYLALRRQYSLLIDGPLILAQTQNQLAQANEKLTKVNVNLESLVAERTEELLKTNQQLKKEIAERKQKEEALEHSEERYRSLVVATSQIVWTTNPDGQVVDMPQWRAYTGQSQEAVLGWGWLDALHPEDRDRTAKIWSHAVATKSLYNTEYRVRGADGNYRYFSVRGVPVLAEDGSIREWVGTCTDISDRKLAEQQIKELNQDLERRVLERTTQLEAANKELETFSYSVSHDLRAPLRSIDGFSQTLLERYAEQLDDKGKHYLQRVRAATQRMGQLIDDLLNLSRVTRSTLLRQTVNLSALVQAIAAELQQTQPERSVEFIIAPGVVAEGDPRLLRVVLENLLNNAWKFTSNKVHPRIEFGTLPQPDGTTAYFVRDNGAGFDMAYANKLFGAFQRLHTADEFPGNGIGLATVQRIIHRHGGRVWAEAAVDLGATFYFTL